MSLLFGVGVATSAADGADPVADAVHAESLGYDFVSASDHPGTDQPTYETWTLLTWIAAATDRIGVASRVLAAPLRAPAMMAKAAESLDRLCGGRLILGLGAGAVDDELAGFGVGHTQLRRKIRGLEETLHIVRGLWSEPAPTYRGQVYHVEQARLEPKPSRPISIWLGTFGSRALEITGRLADGWIPSRGYAPDEQLPVMLGRVRAAAEGAGRDPAALTCILNLQVDLSVQSSEQFAGELLRFVAAGFDGFNFLPAAGPGAAEQRERLVSDVIPIVRSG